MAKSNHVARPMNDVSLFNSQVDIIVPFYGQYDKVMKLIDSLFRLTRSNYYQLILVDDCSPNPEFIRNIDLNSQKNSQRLRQRNVVKAIRTEEQKGFAGACKVGFESGESPYVCFLNSDCVIEDAGWLKNMGESLLKLKSEGVRVVSAVTNNPVGGDSSQKGERFVREENDVILKDDSFLSLFCFMCHRELFSRIDGFIKEYPFGYYEDEEFAARLKKYSFKQAVCKSAYVYHEGQATVHHIWKSHPTARKIMEEENRKRCIEDMKLLKS
jgi:glycosyltransferase involved in cell wall biosynthesis